MKRTELRRKTPLVAKTPLTSKQPTLTRTRRLRPVSSKRQIEQRTYSQLRVLFLAEHEACEVPGCRKQATEVHHMRGRVGSDYLNTDTWLAVCHEDHQIITENPRWAIELGLSLPRVGRGDRA